MELAIVKGDHSGVGETKLLYRHLYNRDLIGAAGMAIACHMLRLLIDSSSALTNWKSAQPCYARN
eukprot:1156297-Pelagomonas_calceolata.AAC.1